MQSGHCLTALTSPAETGKQFVWSHSEAMQWKGNTIMSIQTLIPGAPHGPQKSSEAHAENLSKTGWPKGEWPALSMKVILPLNSREQRVRHYKMLDSMPVYLLLCHSFALLAYWKAHFLHLFFIFLFLLMLTSLNGNNFFLLVQIWTCHTNIFHWLQYKQIYFIFSSMFWMHQNIHL